MKGEIIAFHLFDVGGTLDLARLERALEPRQARRAPPVGKGTPAYVEFPKPLVVPHGRIPLHGADGTVEADVSFLYFPIGAVSVRFRAAFDVATLHDLVPWNRLETDVGGRRLDLGRAARALVEQERVLWEPAVRDRYTPDVLHESYTVFALSRVDESAEAFLERHGRDVAGLLAGEGAGRLHEREVKEGIKKWFSYYSDDLIVIDWDAALIVDPDADYEDLLFVLEIANLQLLQFRAYDAYLDAKITRAYDDVEALFRASGMFRNVNRAAKELSLLRMEIAELADETDNITKFLGDWFLARVYQAAQEKFHLADWRATVDAKLATVNKLYDLVRAESNNARLLTLEILIVLLFAIDLVLLFVK